MKKKYDLIEVITISLGFFILFSLLLDVLIKYLPLLSSYLLPVFKIQQWIYWPCCAVVFCIIIISIFRTRKDKVVVEEKDDYCDSRLLLVHERIHPVFSALLLLTVTLIAIAVRFYKLDLVPINFDEAYWNYWAAYYSQSNEIVYYGHVPMVFGGVLRPLFPFVILCFKPFIDDPLYAIRIPAAILGVSTVILNYFFMKRTQGQRTAVFSSLWLAVLPWHVLFSRTGEEKVLVPLFGLVIFYCLYRALQEADERYFLLTCFFLGIGSFYTYQPAIVFIAVFILVLLLTKKDLFVLPRKVLLCGWMILSLFIYPFVSLYLADKFNFCTTFYRFYQQNPFVPGPIWLSLWQNLQSNFLPAVRGLFCSQQIYFFYGEVLKWPLLVNCLSFFLFIGGMVFLCWKKQLIDKIVLAWLLSAFLLTIAFVDFVEARYILVILPMPLIVVGVFLAACARYRFVKYLSNIAFLFLIILSLLQLYQYGKNCPANFNACRENSYGCKQAANFLLEQTDLRQARIVLDDRMAPVRPYLNYYKSSTGYSDADFDLLHSAFIEVAALDHRIPTYYLIWAPQTHPEEYGAGIFSKLHKSFRQLFLNEKSIEVIEYPNGSPAIVIYRVEQD